MPGDEGLTYDSETELEWLDITWTQELSYNDVVGWLQDQSDELYGFRYATAAEMYAMFGIFWTPAGGLQDDYFDEAAALMGLLGKTNIEGSWQRSYGMYDDTINGSSDERAGAAGLMIDTLPQQRYGYVGEDSADLMTNPNPVVGSWLVRTDGQSAPVPEPATLTILGVGLVGLLVLRRKVSHKR